MDLNRDSKEDDLIHTSKSLGSLWEKTELLESTWQDFKSKLKPDIQPLVHPLDGLVSDYLSSLKQRWVELEHKVNELEAQRRQFEAMLESQSIPQELIKTQIQLEKRVKELQSLYELEKDIGITKSLDQLLQVITERTIKIIGAQDGSIMLVDKETNELYFKLAREKQLKKVRLKIGEGIAGWVAQHGKPLIVNDVTKDERWRRPIAEDIKFPTKSIMCLPLIRNEEVIGVISLINKVSEGEIFTEDDLRMLTILGAQIAKAIESARLMEENQKAERLASLGRMASAIIHDIKNPMAVIKGFADMLGRKSPENKKYTDKIIGAIDRLVSMTQEILDYSKGETKLTLKKCKVSDLINDVVSFIEMDYKDRHIDLIINLDYTDDIVVDEAKIKRVFFNMTSNAKDAMPGGGKLSISSYKEGEYVVFKISDNGCGMPEHIRESVFEPFVTYGKPNGTGLGMAIVKRIVENHHGTVSVDSKEGVGTTFFVKLPINQEEQ